MITFIGNNANKQIITDGGRLKMRLFIDLLKREGNEVGVIELDGWKKRFLSIISAIKHAIKRNDTIVIMAGPKGCRFIIPIVCHYNKKRKARVVFCPVGIGTVDKLVKNLPQAQIDDFINCRNFQGIKDEKMKSLLQKLDFVCPENDIQNNLYKSYYELKNTCVIENFRDIDIEEKKYSNSTQQLSIIYASRVKEYKGILDLMEVVTEINKQNSFKVKLDIYGDNQLQNENSDRFIKMLNDNISYFGAVPTDEVSKKIREHDLFCLPTQYYGEGTSGALVEALIAGTPALVSSYTQVNYLIENNKNGFIFKIGSKDDLKKRILEIMNNKSILKEIGISAQESARRFTYSYNRQTFLNIMVGEQK